MKTTIILLLLLSLSFPLFTYLSKSYTSIYLLPQGSGLFVIVNGGIYLDIQNRIFSMVNNSSTLKRYNTTFIIYFDGFYFITSNDTLFCLNGSKAVPINVSYPQRVFVDAYPNEAYVTSNEYAYVINDNHIVKSYFIYESFGFITFAKTNAIVDSQTGFTFLYYNGSQKTTIYYQDALTWMTFENSTFIVDRFSPNGLWVFTNLSVLNLPVIPVNYFSHLPYYYNIDYIPLPLTPYWIYYKSGLIFVGGHNGYVIVNAENNYQIIYLNYTIVYDVHSYNNVFYIPTNNGLIKLTYTPPLIYSLMMKEIGLPNGSIWTVIINDMRYTVYNDSLTLHLAGNEVYNVSSTNYLSFKTNITSIELNLSKNSLMVVNYSDTKVPLSIVIDGIENYTKWILYLNGKEYEELGNKITVQLHYPITNLINVSIPSFKIPLIDLFFIVSCNTMLMFTATPVLTTSNTAVSVINSNGNNNSQFFLSVGVALVIIVIFMIWMVKRNA
ncbi:hypothetical protein [Saccharolobus shibatae]|uniref:Thermopsin n=1 Tax=Saccharolobus shibatae TaxID=2286 RepID=A0A8F5GY47_9CREN|nr:hypothetical protein [Saccharolobus shibatae]QXJ33824.1 hypothetical protein J5U22_00369 [Saccharolobus shibatae]